MGSRAGIRTAGSADARSDVFSLGALLEDVMRPESPRPLAAIARKARAANPEERYASVRLLAADAARFMDGLAVTAYRETPWERLVRFARGNRTLLLLLAAYLAMRLLLFAIR